MFSVETFIAFLCNCTNKNISLTRWGVCDMLSTSNVTLIIQLGRGYMVKGHWEA